MRLALTLAPRHCGKQRQCPQLHPFPSHRVGGGWTPSPPLADPRMSWHSGNQWARRGLLLAGDSVSGTPTPHKPVRKLLLHVSWRP